MNIFSYIVARDYGFAPNPFHGICTLATCKPKLREKAEVGDLIIGTGSAKNKKSGELVFAMKVGETLSFDDYWNDPRFNNKKPKFTSLKRAYGDNIYHTGPARDWIQEDSHHSFENGVQNVDNLNRDTSANKVLLAEDFIYWGGNGPIVPIRFRHWNGNDLCAGRGYKRHFPKDMVREVFEWYDDIQEKGFLFEPLMFAKRHGYLR